MPVQRLVIGKRAFEQGAAVHLVPDGVPDKAQTPLFKKAGKELTLAVVKAVGCVARVNVTVPLRILVHGVEHGHVGAVGGVQRGAVTV